jgi:SnoaL-like protein
MSVDVLDPLARLLAERACERLLVEFIRRLDLGDPSEVAALFTEDDVWEWPAGGRRVQGRDDLARYFGSRPADRLSRRLSTNVLVTVRSPDAAVATSYFATYRVDGWAGELQPPPAPTQVGHYEDVFRRVDGAWLLASRKTVLAFGGPTPRADVPG